MKPAARATKPAAPPRRKQPPKAAPALRIEGPKPAEIAVSLDRVQRAMIDEYGELDRIMQFNAPLLARYLPQPLCEQLAANLDWQRSAAEAR